MNSAKFSKGDYSNSARSSMANKSAISFSIPNKVERHHPQFACHGWHLPLATSPIASRRDCEAQGVKRKKRVPWSKSEDDLLFHLVKDSGTSKPNWSKIAYEIKVAIETTRSGKQCRERWLNHLRPNIQKGNWTRQEEAMIRYYHDAFGPKWACMAKVMKNRTDNDLKNKWNSMLRTEGREVTSPGPAWKAGAAHSAVGEGESVFRTEFENASWKPRSHPMLSSTTSSLQPYITTESSSSHHSLLPSGLAIPAVVTDNDNTHTYAGAGQVNWGSKLQF